MINFIIVDYVLLRTRTKFGEHGFCFSAPAVCDTLLSDLQNVTDMNHRLCSSNSPVWMATARVNGQSWILTPVGSTPLNPSPKHLSQLIMSARQTPVPGLVQISPRELLWNWVNLMKICFIYTPFSENSPTGRSINRILYLIWLKWCRITQSCSWDVVDNASHLGVMSSKNPFWGFGEAFEVFSSQTSEKLILL